MRKALWLIESVAISTVAGAVALMLMTWVPEDRRFWIYVVEAGFLVSGVIQGAQLWAGDEKR